MGKSLIYELKAPFELSSHEVDLGKAGANEVSAVTEFSAVSSGTEVAAWLGKPPLRPSTTYPRLIGYCNLARVTEVGASVTDISPGDFILTHQSHRSAFICPRSEVLLHLTETDEQTRKNITATYLYHLGYDALQHANFTPGCEVAIVGLGLLGITTASLLQTFGCRPLLFSNQFSPEMKSESRMRVFPKKPIEREELQKACGMDGVDIVVNTSNEWQDHLLSMQLARKGGQVVCLGFPGRGEPEPPFNPLDSQFFYDRQLSLKHCGYTPDHDVPPHDIRFTKKRNLRYLASLIVDGRLDPTNILKIESSWRELGAVYKELASRKPGMYSALLRWSS